MDKQKKEPEVQEAETVSEKMTAEVGKDSKLVDVFVPKGYGKDDPNCFVCINGKNYIVPRGKSVKVPKAVADELARSERAQRRFDQTVAELQEATANNTLGK